LSRELVRIGSQGSTFDQMRKLWCCGVLHVT